MSVSSTFRSVIALVALVSCSGPVVLALDPTRGMSQYLRDRWDTDTAFPGGAVYSITQTADGYLWIAGQRGLVRFDGLRFQIRQPYELTASNDSTIVGLAAPDGGLWVLLRRGGFMRVRGNRYERVLPRRARADSLVTAMTSTPSGMVAVDVNRGIVAQRAGSFETVVEPSALGASVVIAVAQTRDGQLWLGTRDSGVLRVIDGGRVVSITDGLPDRKVNTLLPRRTTAELWIGTDAGLAIWNGTTITPLRSVLDGTQVLSMLEDRDGNVWVGTQSNGLFRIDPRGRVTPAGHRDDSKDSVAALYEDRDGNIWVGSNSGLERLRDAAFTTYSTAEGLPAERIGVVYADTLANTWFAPLDGGLFRLRDGQVIPVMDDGLTDDVVYSITGGEDAVWIGRQRGGLTRIRLHGDSREVRRFTQADGLAQNSVYSVFRARDGAIWAGTLSGGVSRLHGGQFTTYTAADGLASNMVAAIAETPDGAMWFATPNGVSRFVNGTWRRFAVADGLPSNEVTALLPNRSGGLWVGTAGGLVLLDGVHEPSLSEAPLRTRAPVLSLAEDRKGGLWIATADRIMRAAGNHLAAGHLDAREFGLEDGLLSLQGVKRASGISIDARGRVWIATQRGLSVTDPSSPAGRPAPGLAQVEEVSVDGIPINASGPIEIQPRPQRIRFAYTGLSLAVPGRVAFKYRLDGFDADWSEPSSRREAEYTNLGPGTYRFRVTASNSDGVWSNSEAVVPFVVQPAFWQTRTFQLALAALAGLAAGGVYVLRLRHVARRLNERFEARLAERTRIAQELHDTLLQGVVSASMQLHVLAARLPPDSPERPTLDRLVALVRRVVDDGRNAVRGLRASSGSLDLDKAFSAIPQELALGESTGYRVVVDGKPRPLNPIIRDEVYSIGREALLNAFRHAQAGQVEVELEYASELRVCVRDDGRGIDPAILDSGSEGHWGLTGMRERAQRIGARLTVWSSGAAGTEIELLVPGTIAYQEPRA